MRKLSLKTLEKRLGNYYYPLTKENMEATFALLEQIVSYQDKELEANARFQYFQHLVHLGMGDEALPQFAWLVSYMDNADKEGLFVDKMAIIWGHKWMMDDLPAFADIPKKKLDELWKKFELTYRQEGAKEVVINYIAIENYLIRGELLKAKAYMTRYMAERFKRSDFSDCWACQQNRIVDMYNYFKRYKSALKFTAQLGKPGFVCSGVPKSTYPKFCYAYLMSGDMEGAEFMYRKTRSNLELDINNITLYSHIILYLASIKKWNAGLKIIKAQWTFYLSTKKDFHQIMFLFGLQVFFKRMQNSGHLKMKWEFLDLATDKSGKVKISELLEFIDNQLQFHLNRLNKRNGNSFWTEYIQETSIELEKRFKSIDKKEKQKLKQEA